MEQRAREENSPLFGASHGLYALGMRASFFKHFPLDFLQHLFAQNKEKLIHSALTSLLSRDVSEDERMPVEELEQQFHALRRLVASKAGFSGFTCLPGFREKIGVKVSDSRPYSG